MIGTYLYIDDIDMTSRNEDGERNNRLGTVGIDVELEIHMLLNRNDHARDTSKITAPALSNNLASV